MTDHESTDVLIVGAGVAGLTAGIFTARAGFDTLLVNAGESILNRNSHLENVPGFPAGVNSRTFLELTREQARRVGCEFADGEVVAVRETEDGFSVGFSDGSLHARYVVAASWSDSSYLEGLDIEFDQRGSKQYVVVDDLGHTGVEGLYAAGRIAEQYHQTVVAAGHGAQVALTLIDDSEVPFYHYRSKVGPQFENAQGSPDRLGKETALLDPSKVDTNDVQNRVTTLFTGFPFLRSSCDELTVT